MSNASKERRAEIEAGLRRLKPAVADAFVVAAEVSEALFSEADLNQWQELTWQLADAGWHGWETTSDYLSLVREGAEPERLLGIGQYCVDFVGHSFEPGRTYLRGIAQLENDAIRNELEQTGQALRGRFQQASNLHTQFFKAALSVAENENLEGVTAWSQIVIEATRLERQDVLNILQGTMKSPVQDWTNLARIALAHYPNAIHFLAFSDEVQQSLVAIESDLLELIFTYSKESQDAAEFYIQLAKVLPVLGANQSRTLLGLLHELSGHAPNIDQAAALVETAEQLPLDQEWLMQAWLANRPETENNQALLAYLKLDSAQSEAELQNLRGQVRLHEEQRTLQLFAEGLCGARLRIEGGEGLPTSDGVVVKLPGEVSVYENRPDNFRFLKTALVHQLGCYEFGTFALRSAGHLTAFAAHFNHFEQPMLAETIFSICEAARIDWRVQSRYPGSGADLGEEKQYELSRRGQLPTEPRRQLLEAMVVRSLDGSLWEQVDVRLKADVLFLEEQIGKLQQPVATVTDSMDIMALCYEVVSLAPFTLHGLEPVAYRGHIPFDDASLNLQLTALEDLQAELAEEFGDEEDGLEMHGATDPADLDVDELEAGDVDDPSAILPADDELSGDDFDQVDDPNGMKRVQELIARRQEVEQTFRYDEWDYGIGDYRRRWCTLYEFRTLEQNFDFVPDTLAEHRALANRVRRQLNMLRPELLRKVKGVIDGEELDLERAIEAMVDKKSGVSPSEHIYVQRQRKERDVAALFLLDMSASTDDLIEPEPTVYTEQDDEYLHGFSFPEEDTPKERGKTILDLEKESVVLMAEALEGLGDSYAVCGFSGYGRDRVEYYVCKDFDQPYNYHAKANIGGIKPCRSTRMGPAIRHATKMLSATESRVKALIIISDGYPQDFDYGQDRNSKDYGIKDTTKALSEASQKGVQSFCLTVDPSGHDYLREMCPDQQYMVMQDITQLPDELSKVYRGLTS